MNCVVVGAGAWGLPAATELARRGHRVTLIDRYGPLNGLSSSAGSTRLWRLADPDPLRVRMAQRGVDAMRRLAERAGTAVFLTRGLLWRDDVSLPAVAATLDGLGIACTGVAAGDVDRFFPGLRSDGREALWQPEAGVVLAAASLRAQFKIFQSCPGATLLVRDVARIEKRSLGVRVAFAEGDTIDADVAVIAAGPGASALLAPLGLELPLHPYLEQVVYFGDPADPGAADGFPCLFDGPSGCRPGIYAMPSPGAGYKIGLDAPLRDYRADDLDRTPEGSRTAVLRDRVRADMPSVVPTVLHAQVCSWTDSPDGTFVVDRLDGGIVVACGDSGEGFKYSALMGEVLADLAEGGTPDADVAAWSSARFAAGIPLRSGPNVLGRH